MAATNTSVRMLAVGPLELIRRALPKDRQFIITAVANIVEFTPGRVLGLCSDRQSTCELELNQFDVIAVVGNQLVGGIQRFKVQLQQHNPGKNTPTIREVLEWSCECGAREPFLDEPGKNSPYYDHRCIDGWFSMHDIVKIINAGSLLTGLLAACFLHWHTAIFVAALLSGCGVALVVTETIMSVQIGGAGIFFVLLAMITAPLLSAMVLWWHSSLTIMSWLAASWLGIVSFFAGTRSGTCIATRRLMRPRQN